MLMQSLPHVSCEHMLGAVIFWWARGQDTARVKTLEIFHDANHLKLHLDIHGQIITEMQSTHIHNAVDARRQDATSANALL